MLHFFTIHGLIGLAIVGAGAGLSWVAARAFMK
jgi:hypothetical protein